MIKLGCCLAINNEFQPRGAQHSIQESGMLSCPDNGEEQRQRMTSKTKTAFITPSYHGDFERCRLLCETTKAFLPAGVEHILIIDQRDHAQFKPLESGPVRIAISENVMGRKARQRLFGMLPGLPIRGWIWQQLCKIAAVNVTDAEVLQFVDSDVAFTKHIDIGKLTDDKNRVRLQRVDYHDKSSERWSKIAGSLLGLKSVPASHGYVGNYITWRRDIVLEMMKRIESITSLAWPDAIARHRTFSEYQTYGTFSEQIADPKYERSFIDTRPNIHMTWSLERKPEAIAAFMEGMEPGHFGIMIHSKLGIPVEDYRPYVERLCAQNT
jgi:hypothetical protein